MFFITKKIMKNKITAALALVAVIMLATYSCSKQKEAPITTDYSFTEEFDTVTTSIAKGWMIKNNTKPIGTVGWTQGYFYVSLYHGLVPKSLGTLPFNYPSAGGFGDNNPSFSGADFIMTTSECGFDVANCSNWLISPEMTVKTGDEISFYTRTYSNPALAADRMEVRMNEENSSADVGKDSNSVGSFTKVLLDINPNYLTQGTGSYPGGWLKYRITIEGVDTPQKTRVAFRYYVPGGGPQGQRGLGVAIDKFSFISK